MGTETVDVRTPERRFFDLEILVKELLSRVAALESQAEEDSQFHKTDDYGNRIS